MNIKAAATRTKDFIKEKESAREAFDLVHTPGTYTHTLSALTKIQLESVTGNDALRWLDWAQSNIVRANVGTQEEMEHINDVV